MDNIRRVAIVACVIFAGALVGDLLQWLLPAQSLVCTTFAQTPRRGAPYDGKFCAS